MAWAGAGAGFNRKQINLFYVIHHFSNFSKASLKLHNKLAIVIKIDFSNLLIKRGYSINAGGTFKAFSP